MRNFYFLKVPAGFSKKVYLYIACAALIFASMEVFLKIAGVSLDPFQITFLRFLFGGLVLLPFAVKEYMALPKGVLTFRLWLTLASLGAILAANITFFQFGVNFSNASTTAVIFCINPVFTMSFAHLLTADDKLNRWKILALALFVTGLIFMIRPWDIQEGNTIRGVIFTVVSSALFGLFTVIGGKTLNRLGVFNQTTICFFIGALILLLFLLSTGRPVFEGAAANLGLVLYFGAVVTGVGYLFFFLAMKHSNASTTSVTFFLKPVIAPVFAVAILGETITYNMYIGIALILAASYIMTFRAKHT